MLFIYLLNLVLVSSLFAHATDVIMSSIKSQPVPKIKYKSFTEVNLLSTNELKALCLRHHISNTLPKAARVIFLCHLLGLSTVGSVSPDSDFLTIAEERLTEEQLSTLKKLSPVNLLRLKSWSRDISSLPDVDENQVKSYLLGCNILDSSAVKKYKLSRAYQLKDNIHSVLVTKHPEYSDFFCIQARCNPSQSTKADDVKVLHLVLDTLTGDPCSAYCTCTVGFTQACGHVGALLCLLADWQAHGVTTAPNQPACTDKLCSWINPKAAAVKPKRFQDVGQEIHPRKRRRTTQDYGNTVTSASKSVIPENVKGLRADLIQAASRVVCSGVPSRFPDTCFPATPPCFLLPSCDPLCPELAFSSEVTVTNLPLPIASLPHKTFPDATDPSFMTEVDTFLSFPYSTEDLLSIPELTIGQSSNLEWFLQKHGSLTSSNFGRIIRYVTTRKADPDVLVRDVMGYRQEANPHEMKTSVPSLKYGQRYESVARNAYVSRQKKSHKSLEVRETGLHVHFDYPHLRASPDGIVSCRCHPTTLLEIKCPYTARDMSVREAIRSKTLTYLELLPDFTLQLKQGTDYYHQVQGAMAVVGLDRCDFVVYTKKSMEIVTIDFNPLFWKDTVTKLNYFFEVYVVPEILTARIKKLCNVPPPPPPSASPPLTIITRCAVCGKELPDDADNIAADNSNAAVACDCTCGCATAECWYCWPCVGYTDTMAAAAEDWFCVKCINSCV